MYTNNNWGKSLDILQRNMSVNLYRQEVIANNIANADTPNFKRQEVNYETSLKKALESENRPVFDAYLTNDKHVAFDREIDYRTVVPRRVTDFLTTAKNNGNNVDIEVESTNFINAQLSYNLMVSSVNHNFNNLNIVLQ
ncbi:flagellar basal body rod protein FlgB [Salinispira pacifica]|jgi:flagellar basal-body rod protein FlgB|uniref:Flagellar basal body rod protein FlgB n=1 Tax=Salinispira pacifica TaxID=1307761 RepID=V5WG36_9SPIO|nr:flagellar basal body rod protein FlgB [Salinispira pacifica]AHC14575.1 Flagellar basal-body rod protein FlgB [Salinispira pacifica]